MNRRGFLRTGAAAVAAGVMGAITAPAKVTSAAVNKFDYAPIGKPWSVLQPKPNYGGAAVRYVDHNEQWLGTTRIVGKVKRFNEAMGGFYLALQGKLDPKAKLGLMSLDMRYPLGDALAFCVHPMGETAMVTGTPRPDKLPIPDPEQMSRNIKDVAYWLRADEVGIGKMPEYAYWSRKLVDKMGLAMGKSVEECTIPNPEPELPYVITVMVQQHLETFLASTGYDGIANSQSYRCYHATAQIAVILARYIRALGYNASAHHFANYRAVLPPTLIASGMGELCRTGDCTLHPRFGFRNKVAAVTTDLPLVPDKPIDFGLQDFCRVCRKCAENCPADAITLDSDPVEYNGYLRWNSDMKKCAEFRSANDEGNCCARCIKVCPWNSKEDSWFHEAGLYIGSKGETASTLLKSIDDMFGYGTEMVDKYKWWIEWPEIYKVPADFGEFMRLNTGT